jgi:demethylmenaquinone methyltransferase/2-methoxy-6-polyprenyl-1,4-benzoquinol methylase
MSKPAHYYDPYDWLAPYYDWMARVLLIPFGGETRFRRRAIEALDIHAGDEVLELGCGTGRMTRHLLSARARVTALDLSAPMLERARRAAPGARILEHDILDFEGDHRFDRVLLSFVLHEMQRDIRARALKVAASAVRPGGLVGVLDFAGHAPRPIDRVFRAYLRVAEPEMAGELLQDSLPSELEDAGLKLVRQVPLAAGTAQMLVGQL